MLVIHSTPIVCIRTLSGTVDKVFLDRVRVLDMEEQCWDVAFDEITAIYP